MATSTMREYFANAIEQGIERGEVKGRQEYILRIVARRFGAVPMALQERLTQITDLARLDALFDAALTVGGIEEFAALLSQTTR